MREWKDYDDSLDYDELKRREEQRLEYIRTKQAADEAEIRSRRNKITLILSSIVLVAAVVAVVYAITHQTASPSYNQPVVIRDEFSTDLTGQIATPEMGSGDEISYGPTFTNTGNVETYVFIKFDTATYTPAGGSEQSIYTFTPDDATWTQIESDNPGQLLFAYTESDSEMKVVGANEEISLTGTLKMVADNGSLAGFSDEDAGFHVTGCAIDTLGSVDPTGAYNEYIGAGGE